MGERTGQGGGEFRVTETGDAALSAPLADAVVVEPVPAAAGPIDFESFGHHRVVRDLGDGYSEDSHGGLYRTNRTTGERVILRLSKWD